MLRRTLTFIFVVVLASSAQAEVTAPDSQNSVAEDCALSMEGLAGDTYPASHESLSIVDSDELTKEVEVIWYPSSKYFFLTHTEINVDGTVWDGTMAFKKSSTVKASKRAAKKSRGYVNFALRVSPKELSNMKNYLETKDGKPSFAMCSGGACKIVTKNSGIVIPWPLAQIPVIMAAYLTLGKLVGYNRIAKVEWIGPKKISKYFSPSYLGLYGIYQELHLTHSLVISVVTSAHQLIKYLIPIISGINMGYEDVPTSEFVCKAS